jgi:hypothetical protein
MAALLIWSGPASQRTSTSSTVAPVAGPVAVPPAMVPAAQPASSGRDDRNFGGPNFGGPLNNPALNRIRWRRLQDSSEWPKFLEFLRINSPNRYQMVSTNTTMPHPALARRWEQIEAIKDKQPKLYQYRVQQIQKEDDVIGLLFQYRQAIRDNDPIAQGQAYEKIRQDAKSLVDLGLEERELRLDLITGLLSQARADLEKDKTKSDASVTDKTSQIINKAGSLPLFDSQPGKSQASPGAGGQ